MHRAIFAFAAVATLSACGNAPPPPPTRTAEAAVFDRDQYRTLVRQLKADSIWTHSEPRIGMMAWSEVIELEDCRFAVRSGGSTRSSFLDTSFDIREIHANSDGVDRDEISGHVNLACNDSKPCTTERSASGFGREGHGRQVGPRVQAGREAGVFKTIEELKALCLAAGAPR